MPLNGPPLDVAPGPSSVQRARRWVIEAVSGLGREELAETSELGVSELVTNAVLHGRPPITLQLRGTRAHPRVEVRDGSTEPPVMPSGEPPELGDWDEEAADDALLATIGRGLEIVARCADAWGAEIDDVGKVIWFSPARAPREDAVPGTIAGVEEQSAASSDALVPFRVLGAPVRDLSAFGQHYRELSREMRLLTLAHESEYPVAQRLSTLLVSMERLLRDRLDGNEVQAAVDAGHATVDLTVRLIPEDVSELSGFVHLLDFADDFCRDELLALARTPAQREFQTWFLTEFERQFRGESPRPWPTGSTASPQA